MLCSSRVISLLLCAGLAACGGGGGGGNTNPPPPVQNFQMVEGRLLAPDGVTPIAGATVYWSSNQIAAPDVKTQKTVQEISTSCDAIAGVAGSVCTDAAGRYAVQIVANSTGPLALNFKKGIFNAALDLRTVVSGNTNQIIRLPNTLLETDHLSGGPRIAVVTGEYDQIETLLAKLGFAQLEMDNATLVDGSARFDLYSGRFSNFTDTPQMSQLFLDPDFDGKAEIFNYDIVFINCGTYTYEQTILSSPESIAVIRTYVAQGGKLYVTDQSYNFVEQVFPEKIQFFADSASTPLEPGILGAADVGGEMDMTRATLHDPQLLAWLKEVTCFENAACVNSDDTVDIYHFLPAWAVIDAVSDPQAVKMWVDGTVDFFGSVGVVKPLTVSFSYGKGKVLYTSYHTSEEPHSGVEPQERILQYLMFEM